jgi:hypothetical protein
MCETLKMKVKHLMQMEQHSRVGPWRLEMFHFDPLLPDLLPIHRQLMKKPVTMAATCSVTRRIVLL